MRARQTQDNRRFLSGMSVWAISIVATVSSSLFSGTSELLSVYLRGAGFVLFVVGYLIMMWHLAQVRLVKYLDKPKT